MTDPQISYQGPRWFVGRTKFGKERRVRFELGMGGYRVFFPQERRWRRVGTEKRPEYYPVFPRYVFVEIDYPSQPFPVADHRSGLDGFLSNLGVPVAIPSSYVELLIISQVRGDFDAIKNDPLPVGARVAVMEGEFHDMLATVVSKKHGVVTIKPKGTNKHVRAHFGSLRPAEPDACELVTV